MKRGQKRKPGMTRKERRADARKDIVARTRTIDDAKQTAMLARALINGRRTRSYP